MVLAIHRGWLIVTFSHIQFFYCGHNSKKQLMFHLENQLLNLLKGIQGFSAIKVLIDFNRF